MDKPLRNPALQQTNKGLDLKKGQYFVKTEGVRGDTKAFESFRNVKNSKYNPTLLNEVKDLRGGVQVLQSKNKLDPVLNQLKQARFMLQKTKPPKPNTLTILKNSPNKYVSNTKLKDLRPQSVRGEYTFIEEPSNVVSKGFRPGQKSKLFNKLNSLKLENSHESNFIASNVKDSVFSETIKLNTPLKSINFDSAIGVSAVHLNNELKSDSNHPLSTSAPQVVLGGLKSETPPVYVPNPGVPPPIHVPNPGVPPPPSSPTPPPPPPPNHVPGKTINPPTPRSFFPNFKHKIKPVKTNVYNKTFQQKKYTPSGTSLLFKIQGKPTKFGSKSGLGIKPIKVVKPKKKKSYGVVKHGIF